MGGKSLINLTFVEFVVILTVLYIYVIMYQVKSNIMFYTLIQRGGGTGPMKPGNRCLKHQVPIPAGFYPER